MRYAAATLQSRAARDVGLAQQERADAQRLGDANVAGAANLVALGVRHKRVPRAVCDALITADLLLTQFVDSRPEMAEVAGLMRPRHCHANIELAQSTVNLLVGRQRQLLIFVLALIFGHDRQQCTSTWRPSQEALPTHAI